MTTLDNGIVIDETITAHNYTPDPQVPATFGYASIKTGVTVHHWGDDGQNFEGVVNYLASPNTRSSSAHFIVQEDRVTCIVNPDDAAWHSGHPQGNAQTIGIECRPEMTPGDLNTLAALIRYLETIYGSLAIYRHSDWINTACPGRYAPQIDDIVNAVNGGISTNQPAPPAPAGPAHTCCCN